LEPVHIALCKRMSQVLAHSCPGRVRRHVRSWRKPTPHSRRIRWSAFGLLCQGPPAAQVAAITAQGLRPSPPEGVAGSAALVALGPRAWPLPLSFSFDGGGGPSLAERRIHMAEAKSVSRLELAREEVDLVEEEPVPQNSSGIARAHGLVRPSF
jgi:hypothetical protein